MISPKKNTTITVIACLKMLLIQFTVSIDSVPEYTPEQV